MILQILNNTDGQVDADFSEAFDKVPDDQLCAFYHIQEMCSYSIAQFFGRINFW